MSEDNIRTGTQWRKVSLGEIADIKGRIGWKGYTVGDLRDSGILVIGGAHISKDHMLCLSKATFISEEKYEESPEIKVLPGDLLMTKTGTIGNVALVPEWNERATINPNTVIIRATKICNKFLHFYLSSSIFQEKITDLVTVGAQPSLNQANLRSFLVPIPPLPEQKKIAEILSGIDMAIRGRQSAITQIDHAIQGIRDQTQTGEGTYIRIGDLIAKISTGVSVNSENRPCKASEHGILKVSCVSKGVFYTSENKVIQGEEIERASMSIKKGMLLMSRANTPELVGACGIASNDYDNLFLPDKIWNLELSESAPCDKRWLNNALNSGIARSRVRDASTGTSNSMRNISQGNFCEIELVIPPLEIQQMQVNTIDSLQKRRKAFAVKLERHLMLKTALSSDLLSGRKRVSI